MAFRKIRVFVVDDSLFFRSALINTLKKDENIEVVGEAADCIVAEKKILELKPDVITLDVEMPGMRGPDFIKKLMPIFPVPIVLVSSVDINVFDALQYGAVDFVRKPSSTKENDFSSFSSELIVKVKIASTAKIKKPIITMPKSLTTLNKSTFGDIVVAIGASTGGTEATLSIIKDFPKSFPPVVITQHMPVGFTKMYADRLDRICNLTVVEAQDNMRLESGMAVIAAGDKQMTIAKDSKGYYIKSKVGEKVSGHCPSVDVLFSSVAKTVKGKAIGVILTGMGRDGASGMLEMRKSGAYTIGQNKETCVVYGMPMVANQIGAVIK
ncbi:MAG: chemotaxis response regulator protein-glutamate methylesterase, partial [Oscillospiraceae bacterium]